MRTLRLPRGALLAALMLGAAGAAETKLPSRDHFLFWTPAEQAFGYKTIEKIFPVRVVKRGATVSPLEAPRKSGKRCAMAGSPTAKASVAPAR